MFSGVLALWQSTAQHELTPGYRPECDLTVPGRHWLCASTSSGGLCINPSRCARGQQPLLRLLPPFANRVGLRFSDYPETSAQGRSGFLLHAVTRLLRPELPHYYGIICHLAPTSTLGFHLGAMCPKFRVRGQASPVTAPAPCKITHPQTRSTSDRVSGFALFCTLTAGRPPNQVRFRYVHLASYGFLQTPPLASGALANRIVFPSVGVTPPSFRWPGLPASPGKQKSHRIRWLLTLSQNERPVSHERFS